LAGREKKNRHYMPKQSVVVVAVKDGCGQNDSTNGILEITQRKRKNTLINLKSPLERRKKSYLEGETRQLKKSGHFTGSGKEQGD